MASKRKNNEEVCLESKEVHLGNMDLQTYYGHMCL